MNQYGRHYWWTNYGNTLEFGAIQVTDSPTPPTSRDGWNGPFDGIVSCRRDAIRYYKTNIENSRAAIREIMAINARDLLGH